MNVSVVSCLAMSVMQQSAVITMTGTLETIGEQAENSSYIHPVVIASLMNIPAPKCVTQQDC